MPVPQALEPWLVLVAALITLVWVQQLLTRILITFLYRLSHNLPLSMLLYAILVWPGTVLHELSHWLVARLLGVRARMPHLLPSKPDRTGRITLGHVMIERTDVVRHALIGIAPLVAGSTVVAIVARYTFQLPVPDVNLGGMRSLLPLLQATPEIFRTADAWLYLYALFAFANAMLPSPSDREAWPTVLLFGALIGSALLLTVGLPQVPDAVAQLGLRAAGWITFAFLVTILLNGFLLILLFPLERLLSTLGR